VGRVRWYVGTDGDGNQILPVQMGMDAVCVVTDWDGTIFHYCAALYKGLSSG